MSEQLDCRICANPTLDPVLDLGATPLANRLLFPGDLAAPEPRYPLRLVFCPQCSLLQIDETVDPQVLFADYVYFSSFSDTVLENARTSTTTLIESRGLGASDLVLEVASNDGYLLQYYREAGIRVLGIEPAENVAATARAKGVETIAEFFGTALARDLEQRGLRASVVHANNVLAHVADLNGFVEGLAIVLRDDGVAVIEVPYVVDMIENCEFDTIYHEHLCYFSATALTRLFEQHGMELIAVERIPIHGGSLRVTAARRGSHRAGESVRAILEQERVWGASQHARYADFSSRVERLRRDLLTLLRDLKSRGSSLAAYGASAKGATLLNFFGIGAETLDYIVDRSTIKQGRLAPGTHLPIVSADVLASTPPDYLLLLTWNHAAEILQQQKAYRDRGGRFIVPVPRVEVI